MVCVQVRLMSRVILCLAGASDAVTAKAINFFPSAEGSAELSAERSAQGIDLRLDSLLGGMG